MTANTTLQPTSVAYEVSACGAWLTRRSRLSVEPLCVMPNSLRPNAKVLFRVIDEEGGTDVETLWATHLGADDYKLDNSPFYAYGVSWEDVVSAPFNPEEGFPTFDRVLSKSGNRTVRVIFETPIETGNESDRVLQGLVALGCSYEGANRKYVSVNVPSHVELNVVRIYLIEQKATWEHADPTYAALFPEDA